MPLQLHLYTVTSNTSLSLAPCRECDTLGQIRQHRMLHGAAEVHDQPAGQGRHVQNRLCAHLRPLDAQPLAVSVLLAQDTE